MTRTALKRNGFSRIPLRSIRQGAKALSKQRTKTGSQEKVTILLQNGKKKLAKCLIWTKNNIISQWKINKIEEN